MNYHPACLFDVVAEYIGTDPMQTPAFARFDHETHELLFTDGTIAVTFYEHVYAVWSVATGAVKYGQLWKPGEWRLDEASRERIAAYAPRRALPDHAARRAAPDLAAWRALATGAKEFADAASPDWYVDPRRPKDVISGGAIPISHITIARSMHSGSRGTREIDDEQGRLDAAFMVAARAGMPMLSGVVLSACDAIAEAHDRISRLEAALASAHAGLAQADATSRALFSARQRQEEQTARVAADDEEWRTP